MNKVIHHLPKLSYKFNSLEPYIDTLTMRIHYTKHHQGYIDNLNKALSSLTAKNFSNFTLEMILNNLDKFPSKLKTAIRNNAGGHYNHSLFWQTLTPKPSKPSTAFQKVIINKFGSFNNFKDTLTRTALSHFGSGWVWLGVDAKKNLVISSTPNQDNPLMRGVVLNILTPILGLDIWEHAYYLKYKNKRADYVKSWWHLVNWESVEKSYDKLS